MLLTQAFWILLIATVHPAILAHASSSSLSNVIYNQQDAGMLRPLLDSDANYLHVNVSHQKNPSRIPRRAIDYMYDVPEQYQQKDTMILIYGGWEPTYHNKLIGVIFILVGLYLSALGFRYRRPTVCVFAWSTFMNVELPDSYIDSESDTLIVTSLFGFIGMGVFSIFHDKAKYIICAMGGFVFALWALSSTKSGVVSQSIVRVISISLCSIIAGVFTLRVERYTIMASTSFIGSFLFFVGVDLFIHTGYLAGIKSVLDWNPWHQGFYVITLATYIILAGTLAYACATFCWQHAINECREFDGTWSLQKPVEISESDDENKDDNTKSIVSSESLTEKTPEYASSTGNKIALITNGIRPSHKSNTPKSTATHTGIPRLTCATKAIKPAENNLGAGTLRNTNYQLLATSSTEDKKTIVVRPDNIHAYTSSSRRITAGGSTGETSSNTSVRSKGKEVDRTSTATWHFDEIPEDPPSPPHVRRQPSPRYVNQVGESSTSAASSLNNSSGYSDDNYSTSRIR
ncbi:hypothetical protein F4703DRAFT_1915010 [Phycomyces blakesleeanus]